MWLGAFPRLRRLTHMVRLFGRCLLQRSLPIFVEGLMTQGAIGGTTMTWTSAESMLTESEYGELSEYREAEFGESVGEWAAPSRRVLPARLVGVVSAFELGVFHPVNGLPSWLYGLLWSVMQLGSLAAVFEVAGIALIARRSRMAVELLAGGPADLLLRERPEGHHRPGTPAEMMSDVVFHGDPAQGLGFRPGTPRCRPRWPRWRCRSWRGAGGVGCGCCRSRWDSRGSWSARTCRANGDIDRGGIMTSAVERNRILLSRVEDRPISTVPVWQLNRSCGAKGWRSSRDAMATAAMLRCQIGRQRVRRRFHGRPPDPDPSTSTDLTAARLRGSPTALPCTAGHRSPVPAGAVPAAATSPAGSRPTSAASPMDLGVPAAPVSGGDQHLDRNSMVPQACRSGRHSTLPVSRAGVPVAVGFGSRFCDSRPGPVRQQPVGGAPGMLEAFAVPSEDYGSPAHEGFVNKCRHVRPIGTMAP